jgi:hypothetical protein
MAGFPISMHYADPCLETTKEESVMIKPKFAIDRAADKAVREAAKRRGFKVRRLTRQEDDKIDRYVVSDPSFAEYLGGFGGRKHQIEPNVSRRNRLFL